jgi:Flp pilus assembly protein TadB
MEVSVGASLAFVYIEQVRTAARRQYAAALREFTTRWSGSAIEPGDDPQLMAYRDEVSRTLVKANNKFRKHDRHSNRVMEIGRRWGIAGAVALGILLVITGLEPCLSVGPLCLLVIALAFVLPVPGLFAYLYWYWRRRTRRLTKWLARMDEKLEFGWTVYSKLAE